MKSIAVVIIFEAIMFFMLRRHGNGMGVYGGHNNNYSNMNKDKTEDKAN